MTVTATVEEVSRDFGAWLEKLIASQDESVLMAGGKPAAKVTPIKSPLPALEAARLLQGDGSSAEDTEWESDIASARATLLPPDAGRWD